MKSKPEEPIKSTHPKLSPGDRLEVVFLGAKHKGTILEKRDGLWVVKLDNGTILPRMDWCYTTKKPFWYIVSKIK
jgi:hypothetical protein